MKSSLLMFCVVLSVQVSPILSQLILPRIFQSPPAPLQGKEKPIIDMPNIVLPPTSGSKNGEGSGDLTISDVIGKERVINIFAGFTRDIDTISKRLDDATSNTTVLAPLNSELQKLARKPWEDPKDYGVLGSQAYEGAEGEDRAHRNLRRFVEAHVVPVSPWKEGDKAETIGGQRIWWDKRDGKRLIQPGNIEVSNVASQVSNGEVWVIQGVLGQS